MGFRDRYNRGRGLTAQFGHRKGVVTWAQIADYVRALQDTAHAAIPASSIVRAPLAAYFLAAIIALIVIESLLVYRRRHAIEV